MSSLSPFCRSARTTSQGQAAPRTAIRKRHAGSGVKVLVSAISLAAVATGCAVPHVASMSNSKPVTKASAAAKPAKSSKPTAAPSASATVAATKAAVTLGVPGGDLSNGSLTRSLDAGSRKLVINYWTDQDPAQWTATR